ncbi:hypothetical protein [Micromonospora sp. NPDC049171]|uniref:hypothetical protein n=1 Tax=Micromonospora sp. NPDC049171 TaxID=3155770 RepID=UPI0033F77524
MRDQHFPQFGHIGCTGQSAADSDNGDRIAAMRGCFVSHGRYLQMLRGGRAGEAGHCELLACTARRRPTAGLPEGKDSIREPLDRGGHRKTGWGMKNFTVH